MHADRRTGALGEALAGFGVLLLGIDIWRESGAGLGKSLQLGALAGKGVLHPVLFVGAGFLLTLLTQSSSAALAIAPTAAADGIVPLTGAAAMVIGANVGTTSTVVLSKSRLLHAGAAGQSGPQVPAQSAERVQCVAEQTGKATRCWEEPDTRPAAVQAGPVTMSQPSDTPDTPARP